TPLAQTPHPRGTTICPGSRFLHSGRGGGSTPPQQTTNCPRDPESSRGRRPTRFGQRHIRADAQSSQALDSFTAAAEAGSARRSKQPSVPEIPNRVVAEGRLDSAATRFGK